MLKTFADFAISLPHGAAGEIDIPCPQCSPSRKKKHAKCLSVNVDKGVWLCAHCGWAGTLKTGGRQSEVEHWRKPIYVRPEPKRIPSSIPADIVKWFEARGISERVLERNYIHAARKYMPQVEDHVTAICFPYYRGGELINAKYRDREKNFCMEAGAERVLYGLNDLDPKRTVIVEGEVDKLSVEQAGITACVSVPDGAPAINAKNYASKFAYLDEPELQDVREWVIAVDADEPGTRLAQELVRRFGSENCKRVMWPDGCKDANDVLTKYGAEKLAACIAGAQDYPISGVVDFADISAEIDLLYAQGTSRGLSTGWPTMDALYTVAPGQVTVVTGIPNSGKSNWVDALMVNMAKQHGWSFGVFSPENQPIANHASRLMEKFASEPFREGPTKRMTPERMAEMKEFVEYHFQFVLPSDDVEWTLDHILNAAAKLVKKYGIRGLVIDPWNELEHLRPERQSETEYISVCLKRVRQFARKHHLHIWIVAHPAKLYRDKDGQYPVPTLYDISGSAHFRNKTDNGIVVWRDMADTSAPVQIHVQKIRFREIGQLGMAKMQYLTATGEYRDFHGPVTDRWSVPA